MSRKSGWVTWPDPVGAPFPAVAAWFGWIFAVDLVNLVAMLRLTRGRWVLPDDGAYGALISARSFLRGSLPQNPLAGQGAGPLYAGLLAPVVAGAGGHDALLVLGVTLVNAALWGWTCLIAWCLVRRQAPAVLGHAAVAAILLSGPVARGFLSGTDFGLTACMALLAWDAWTGAAGGTGPRRWLKPVAATAGLLLARMPGTWLPAAMEAARGPAAGPASTPLFLPGVLALALLGMLPTAAAGRPAWGPGRLAATVIAAALMLVLSADRADPRVWLPLSPLFIVLCFSGLARLGEIGPESWRHPLPRMLAGAWLLTAPPGLVIAMRATSFSAQTCAAQPRPMADHLAALKEPGIVVTTAPGVLGFYSGWNIEEAARGWAARFDRYKAASPSARPRYAALALDDRDPDAAVLRSGGVLELVWTLPHPRGEAGFGLFECHWGPAGPMPSVPGWTVVDEVDCAEPGSEAAHGYSVAAQSAGRFPAAAVMVRRDAATGEPAADAGWITNGGERFIVAARAGRPLLVLMRTFAAEPTSIVPMLNGTALAPFPVSPDPGQFQTILLFSADGAGVLDHNRIQVSAHWPSAEAYASFHYWVMQPVEKGPR